VEWWIRFRVDMGNSILGPARTRAGQVFRSRGAGPEVQRARGEPAASLSGLSALAASGRTGSRSGSPPAGPASVKICARERGGFPRTHITRSRLKGREPAPHLEGRSGIRVCPGSSLVLAFLGSTQPSMGSSAPPAGGHPVRGRLPGDSSSEPRAGELTLTWSVGPARVAWRWRNPQGRGPSYVGRADGGARSMAHAAFSGGGRRCARSQSARDSISLPRAGFLHADFARWRGLSAAPWSPEGSREDCAHAGDRSAWLDSSQW
jgi:hypothetical protein